MMTPLQFESIQKEAYAAGAPHGALAAILREYLQCEVLSILTTLRHSETMALIGGTGIRLLYNLDRFSEDLDFDYCGTDTSIPMQLVRHIAEALRVRGYTVDLRVKRTGPERGGRLVFRNLLFPLRISPHHTGTLMMKMEYIIPQSVPERTTVLLSRFGFATQVTTEPLPALCARKLVALLERKRTQPRDMYDLMWFLSRRIMPDPATLQQWGIPSTKEAKQRLIKHLSYDAATWTGFERDLAPLLLDPAGAIQIRHLPELAKTIE